MKKISIGAFYKASEESIEKALKLGVAGFVNPNEMYAFRVFKIVLARTGMDLANREYSVQYISVLDMRRPYRLKRKPHIVNLFPTHRG